MSEINKFPVKDLPNRYNIGRTALYARFTAANITPEKDGTRSYISGKELEELDRLDCHIKTGGKLEEFKPALQKNEMVLTELTATLDKQAEFSDLVQLVEAIARHLSPTDPLLKFRQLEEAAKQEWILPSSKIKELIGISPKGEEFTRGSFEFIKIGKIGRESGWKIRKTEL